MLVLRNDFTYRDEDVNKKIFTYLLVVIRIGDVYSDCPSDDSAQSVSGLCEMMLRISWHTLKDDVLIVFF